MLVSVIITTKNEEKNIKNCLNSVLEQVSMGYGIELIVVDNNSTDKTKEIAEEYTDKVFNKGPERSAQRNFGAKKAVGQYMLYLDADMALSANVIQECIEKMESNGKIVALYIPEVVVGESFWNKVRRFERSFYNATVIDGTRFMRSEVFHRIGGFDEKLYACEDWDLDKRLKKEGGFAIIETPLCHNENNFSLKRYIEKKGYYSENIEMYLKKWGKNDPDIKKQLGFFYRFGGVFIEEGKWKKMLAHPILTLGMYFMRFLVGIKFLMRKTNG